MPNRTVQLQAGHKTRSGPNCLACVFLQRQKAENENKEGDRKKHQEPFIICSNLFLEENKAKITKSQGPLEVRCHRIWMSSSKGRTVSIQLTESSCSCSVECCLLLYRPSNFKYTSQRFRHTPQCLFASRVLVRHPQILVILRYRADHSSSWSNARKNCIAPVAKSSLTKSRGWVPRPRHT